MRYEVTDTSVEMEDTLGNKLGIHPIFVIEADSAEAALQVWKDAYSNGRGPEGVEVVEVGV